MKVAVVEPVGGSGGMDYYDISMCQSVAKAGVDVCLFTSGVSLSYGNKNFTINNLFSGVYGGGKKFYRLLILIKKLISLVYILRRDQFDLAHLHIFHYDIVTLLLIYSCRSGVKKIVATVHDVESFHGKNLSFYRKLITSQINGLVLHNEISKKAYVENFGILPKFSAVIPHGNYLGFLSKSVGKEAAKAVLQLPQNKKVILFFGQIKKVKGLDVLIEACAALSLKRRDFVVVIAGKVWKDSWNYYSEMIINHKLENFIDARIGYIPNEMVGYFYQSADCIVLPYRKIYQSGVVLMAMSYSCPVIASDIEGMREIIHDNFDGKLFKNASAQSLSDAMNFFLDNPDIARNCAANALKKVDEEYSWGKIGQQLSEFYQDL